MCVLLMLVSADRVLMSPPFSHRLNYGTRRVCDRQTSPATHLEYMLNTSLVMRLKTR